MGVEVRVGKGFNFDMGTAGTGRRDECVGWSEILRYTKLLYLLSINRRLDVFIKLFISKESC